MTLIFPLATSVFADRLRIQSVKWRLERYDELSGLGSGEPLSAQLAPPRWVGDVKLTSMTHAKAAQVQALIESLDGAANEFFLYSPQSPYPQSDPEGLILGSSTVTIHSLGANNKSLRLTGLPAGYTLTLGDMFSFSYGSNPVRQALHRIVETDFASGAGLTSMFEVRPHFRPGVATAIEVALKKPVAKVIIVPGTFDAGEISAATALTEGMSFQVMQRP